MKFLVEANFRSAEDLPGLQESVITLPSPTFNWAVGNGGIVEGKWVLLFGPESGGKSLIAQTIMAAIQKKYPDGICLIFDTEYSISKEWFTKLGGDPSRLFLRQTNKPDEIFDWIEAKLKPKIEEGLPIKAICIDSLAAIRYPKDEKTANSDSVMGGTGAGYLPRAFKSIVPTVRPNNITTILVQQVREEIDMYKKARNPWTIPDGRALKHYSDYMIQIERLDTKDNCLENANGLRIGHKVRVTCKKNKAGAPYRKIEFMLNYDKGIVGIENELFELAKKMGIISHPVSPETGKVNIRSWCITDKPEETFVGEENIREAVCKDAEMQARIMKLLDAIVGEVGEDRDIRLEDGVSLNQEEETVNDS